MKNIILFFCPPIATFFFGMWVEKKVQHSDAWGQGFDDGVAYAVEKYADGKLLKVPDEPMPANFVDCWFVNVLAPQAFVSLRNEGGTLMHGNVISVGGVLSSRTVKANAHERFEQLNKEGQP